MALNRLGVEAFNKPPSPITLPKLNLPDLAIEDIEEEAREAAARVAERRTIRRGLDAWAAINKAESFEGWLAIGAALSIGRDFALRTTGANAPIGRRYSLAFSEWIKRHGFETMAKSVRSVAIELVENIGTIEAWRATLSEKQRRRLVHPLSNVRRWRASTAHDNGRSPTDLRRDAKAAWARFCACVTALPATEAAPLWATALAEAQAAAVLGATL
jgi:hypothetical protein